MRKRTKIKSANLTFIHSVGKKKPTWKVKIAYLLARTPQHCQKPNDTVCITLAPGTKQTSSKKVYSSNLGRRLSPHNHHNYLHSGCLWLRFVFFFFKRWKLFSKYQYLTTKSINSQPLAFSLSDSSMLPLLFLYLSAIKRWFLGVLWIWLNLTYHLAPSQPIPKLSVAGKGKLLQVPKDSWGGVDRGNFFFLHYFPFHKRNRLKERISNALLLDTAH